MNSTSIVVLMLGTLVAGCAGDEGVEPTSPDGGGGGDAATGADQTPPVGAAAVESWLAGGAYKAWASEPVIHASRAPSPHGFNRIFSNDVISSNATGTGAWPVGAAAVKELYATSAATTPIGYSVYLKQAADSAGGANWYWYERIDGYGVIADGAGGGGPAKSICVGCHAGAGRDGAHTPSPGGRDQVFTPVQ